MKIQPYNKNSKHKEAKETFDELGKMLEETESELKKCLEVGHQHEEAKQALHNLYEQKNEEENRKKKNTGCEIVNKVRKEASKFKERIESLIKQRQDVKKLVAEKERIDLEAERANKEIERRAEENRGRVENDSQIIQVGQRIERDRKGEFIIGKEKRRIERGHPPRINRILNFSAGGYWLQIPQGPNFVGKWPKRNIPMRVEPYREEEDRGDREAKYACAYGSNARELLCWYSFDEWKAHFHSYEIPTPTECTFMNGELFTRKIVVGRWGEGEGERGEEEGEDDRQENYQGAKSNYRGRGGWSGYGRGQARNYEDRGYNQRGGFRPRGRGGYRGGRNQ